MSEKIKDQTICEACQLAVAAGGNIDDPLLAQHLQDCPECQQFAEFQKLVMATPLPVERELPEFSNLRQQVHQQKKRSRRFLRMMVWPLSMAAAAAVVPGCAGAAGCGGTAGWGGTTGCMGTMGCTGTPLTGV